MSTIEKEPGPQGDSPVQQVEEGEKKKRVYKDFGHEEEKTTRMSFLYSLSS